MEFETISPREIDSYLFRDGYVVIDLREPKEFRRLHLKGAVCIPYEQLEVLLLLLLCVCMLCMHVTGCM